MKELLSAKLGVPFTQVANAVLNDALISFKAKGLFSYIYSKPKGWEFSGERIAKDSTDGSESVFSGLKELEDRGYLTRNRLPTGRVDYEITWKPHPQKPKEVKTQTGKTRSVSNKEEESNKEEMLKAKQSFAAPKADSFFRVGKGEGKDDGVSMILSDFVLMCRGSQWRSIRLIGEYADERGITLKTRGQWRQFGLRNLRVAKRLAPFTDDQIGKAIKRILNDYDKMERKNGERPKWGMETIEKYLEEVNSAL